MAARMELEVCQISAHDESIIDVPTEKPELENAQPEKKEPAFRDFFEMVEGICRLLVEEDIETLEE